MCNAGKKLALVLSHSIQTRNIKNNSTWNHAMMVDIRTSGLNASFEVSGDAATPARMSIDCTDFRRSTYKIFELISNNISH